MIHVCFVCLGNICRSPTAHGVMEALVRKAGLEGTIAVDSAGTAGYHVGELPDRRTRATAKERGIELDSRARQFQRDDFARFDYVVAMDRQNREALRRLGGQDADGKVTLLRSFENSGAHEADVPDPYYGGEEGFIQVFEICMAGCSALLEQIRREHRL